MSLMLRRAGDRINRRTGRISNGYLRLLRDLSPCDAVARRIIALACLTLC